MKLSAFSGVAAFKGVLWATGSTYISYFLGLATSVLIARALGADSYGRYAYVVWLTGILILTANHGLNTTGIKFISERLGSGSPEEAKGIHNWLRRVQIASIALVAVVYLFLSPLLQPEGSQESVVLIASITLVAFSCKSWSLFNTSMAKGHGQFSIEPIVNSVVTVLSATIVIGIALFRPSLIAFVVAFLLASIGYAVASHVLLAKQQLQPIANTTPDRDLMLRVRSHLLWSAALVAIGVLGGRSIEMLLLNHWVGAAEVGYFSIATALTRAGAELLVAGISSVMMPLIGFALGSSDKTKAQRLFGDACRYYQFFGLLFAGVGLCWAEAIIDLLYGEQYRDIVPIFRIMVLNSGLTLFNGATAAVMANSDHHGFRIGVVVLHSAMTVAIAVALIPTYGILGAVVGQVIVNVLYTIAVVLGIRRFSQLSFPWNDMARQYALALAIGLGCAAVAINFDNHLVSLGTGILFVVTYVFLSLPAGLWRRNEREFVANVLSRFRGLRWIAVLFAHNGK